MLRVSRSLFSDHQFPRAIYDDFTPKEIIKGMLHMRERKHTKKSEIHAIFYCRDPVALISGSTTVAMLQVIF